MFCSPLLLQLAASNAKLRNVDILSSLTHVHQAGFLLNPFPSTLKASQRITVPSCQPLCPFLLQGGCPTATYSPKLDFPSPSHPQARCFASLYARQMDVCHPLTTPNLAASQLLTTPSWLSPSPLLVQVGCLPAPLHPHAKFFPSSYSIKLEACQPLTPNAICFPVHHFPTLHYSLAAAASPPHTHSI